MERAMNFSELTTMTLSLDDHVAVVTLCRPDARNALNRKAYAELESVFRALQADEQVRCIILTGTDPAFCSGDDVKELMTGDASAVACAVASRSAGHHASCGCDVGLR